MTWLTFLRLMFERGTYNFTYCYFIFWVGDFVMYIQFSGFNLPERLLFTFALLSITCTKPTARCAIFTWSWSGKSCSNKKCSDYTITLTCLSIAIPRYHCSGEHLVYMVYFAEAPSLQPSTSHVEAIHRTEMLGDQNYASWQRGKEGSFDTIAYHVNHW